MGSAHRHIRFGLLRWAEVLWDKASKKAPMRLASMLGGVVTSDKHKRRPKVLLVEVGRSRTVVGGWQGSP